VVVRAGAQVGVLANHAERAERDLAERVEDRVVADDRAFAQIRFQGISMRTVGRTRTRGPTRAPKARRISRR
jgi:hypothetical protein